MKNNILINKRQVLDEFFDKDFQHGVSFKLLFRISDYLQKSVLISFRVKVLLGCKSKNDHSPQTRSTKYSEDSSDLRF